MNSFAQLKEKQSGTAITARLRAPQLSGAGQRIALTPLQDAVNRRPQVRAVAQLQEMFDESPRARLPFQRKANQTGMPDQLKAGIESLSNLSLDDVKVQRNSAKPARFHAHAITQGKDIHLGPGQDHHLPHEAWHVVQQAQGRVTATTQMKGTDVNDHAGLEHEADVMGERARQAGFGSQTKAVNASDSIGERSSVILVSPVRARGVVSKPPVQRNGKDDELGKGLPKLPITAVPSPVGPSPLFTPQLKALFLAQALKPQSSLFTSVSPLNLSIPFTKLLPSASTPSLFSQTPKMLSASTMPWLSSVFKMPGLIPPPPPIEFAPMKNSPFRNILSAAMLGLGFGEQRSQGIATDRLNAHRENPEKHHLFHVHSNASQATHAAHTHDVLAAEQARTAKISKEDALADSRLTAERNSILNQTHIVSTGGPMTHTDVPDQNRTMISRREDIVPQLPTYSGLKGKATRPNLIELGDEPPPMLDAVTLSSMEPEQIGAQFIKQTVTGVQEHSYQNKYRKEAEQVTRQKIKELNVPMHVHVGEGVFGTDQGAKKRMEEVRESVSS
jgi:hypothetical protein